MLYIVATPIGNLEDISARALKTLSEVDYILCEDTRQTHKLLDKYNISGRLVSLHEHTNEQKIMGIVEDLKNGKNVAYVSDAGTPNLSDPGGKLLEFAYREGLEVSPIPGASALSALISIAPFPCSDFCFIGYFPKKKGRQTLVKELSEAKNPVFFFESPKRIHKTLQLLNVSLPSKKVLIGRELTKIFEQLIILDLSLDNVDNISNIPEKGEFVLAIFE